MPGGRRWVTASELAEYAYCPRAWYYRSDPPPGGPTASSRQSAEAGVRFHEVELRGTVFRERASAWLVSATAAAVLVVGTLVGLLVFS